MEGDSHDTPTTVPSPSTSPSASTPEQGTGSEDLVGRFAARQPTFEPQTVEKAAGEPEPDLQENQGECGDEADQQQVDEEHDQEPEIRHDGEPPLGDDNWRRDKKGNLLNPGALYMRFYRRVRSILLSQHVINYLLFFKFIIYFFFLAMYICWLYRY